MSRSRTRTTYTYVILELSPAAFAEIKRKMEEADYQQAFHKFDGQMVIDMHGLAVAEEKPDGIREQDESNAEEGSERQGLIAPLKDFIRD